MSFQFHSSTTHDKRVWKVFLVRAVVFVFPIFAVVRCHCNLVLTNSLRRTMRPTKGARPGGSGRQSEWSEKAQSQCSRLTKTCATKNLYQIRRWSTHTHHYVTFDWRSVAHTRPYFQVPTAVPTTGSRHQFIKFSKSIQILLVILPLIYFASILSPKEWIPLF